MATRCRAAQTGVHRTNVQGRRWWTRRSRGWRPIAANGSFSGSTCSSRMHRTGMRGAAPRPPCDTASEIAEADRQIGRLVNALGEATASTLIALTSDHGEAFGEHGEIAHSIFVYDTTLRVPWILAGPGVQPGDRCTSEPRRPRTDRDGAARRQAFDADGIALNSVLRRRGRRIATLYAESFAPLLDFGWSPLRAVRAGGWKYIAAPKPELYRVAEDPAETRNRVADASDRAKALAADVDRYSGDQLPRPAPADREATARFQSLGYVSGGRRSTDRPDPKDRKAMAARIAQVTSGELHGAGARRPAPRDPRRGTGQSAGESAARLRARRIRTMRRRDAAVPKGDRRQVSVGRCAPGAGRLPGGQGRSKRRGRHAARRRRRRTREPCRPRQSRTDAL